MDKREQLVYGRSALRGRRKKSSDMLKSGYGRTSMLRAAEAEDAEAEAAWQKMQKRNRASFAVRGFISVLLFVIVLLMRFSGLKIGSVDYQNLVDSLNSEEFIEGIHFEELAPEEESDKQGDGLQQPGKQGDAQEESDRQEPDRQEDTLRGQPQTQTVEKSDQSV